MVDESQFQVDNLGEWAGNIKFHGVKPEFLDPAHPQETIAYLTIHGRGASMTVPRGKDGEQGPPGEPAQPFNWQPQVSTRANLPQYLTGDDAGNAYVISDTKELVYWDGAEYITISDLLIPGPRGPQGIQGVRGIPGPEGRVGPQGPAGNISDSLDLTNGPGNPGDVLVKSDYGWEARAIREPIRYLVPEGSIQSYSELAIGGAKQQVLTSLTLPPFPFDYTVGISGQIMVGQGANVTVDVEVYANDLKVGQGYGTNPIGLLDNIQNIIGGNHSYMYPVQLQSTAPALVTPETTAGLVPANTNTTITAIAKRNSVIGGSWSVDGTRSSLEVIIYPQRGV